MAHIKAAQALEKAFQLKYPAVEIKNIDALDYTNPVFRNLFSKLYLKISHHAPKVWGYIYDQLDKQTEESLMKELVSLINRLNAQKLINLIEAFQPDHIISTHYLSAEIIDAQGNDRLKAIPSSVTITDYDMHVFWGRPSVNNYFVATDLVKWNLNKRLGVKPENVFVTGIPIHPKFLEPVNRKDLMAKHNLDPDNLTLLFVGGSFGYDQVLDILGVLAGKKIRLNLILVAGNNQKLENEFQRMKFPAEMRTIIFGFVDNMYQLMDISDLIITKAGGSTVTECLAKNLPMILTKPVPGQEEINANFLIENGVAVKAVDQPGLEYKLFDLLADQDKLKAMKKACQKLAKPQAAFEIVERVMGRGLTKT